MTQYQSLRQGDEGSSARPNSLHLPLFLISLGHFEPQSGEKTYFIQIGQSVTSLQPTKVQYLLMSTLEAFMNSQRKTKPSLQSLWRYAKAIMNNIIFVLAISEKDIFINHIFTELKILEFVQWLFTRIKSFSFWFNGWFAFIFFQIWHDCLLGYAST